MGLYGIREQESMRQCQCQCQCQCCDTVFHFHNNPFHRLVIHADYLDVLGSMRRSRAWVMLLFPAPVPSGEGKEEEEQHRISMQCPHHTAHTAKSTQHTAHGTQHTACCSSPVSSLLFDVRPTIAARQPAGRVKEMLSSTVGRWGRYLVV